jgi:hypothetical protein
VSDAGGATVAVKRYRKALLEVHKVARGRGPTVQRIRRIVAEAMGTEDGETLAWRLCSRCGEIKRLVEFETDAALPSGHAYRCLVCKRHSDNTRLRRKRGNGNASSKQEANGVDQARDAAGGRSAATTRGRLSSGDD